MFNLLTAAQSKKKKKKKAIDLLTRKQRIKKF